MVFDRVGHEEDKDYFYVRLSYQPVSGFQGELGVEELVIDKTGTVEFRHIIGMPKPVGSQSGREEAARREHEETARRDRKGARHRGRYPPPQPGDQRRDARDLQGLLLKMAKATRRTTSSADPSIRTSPTTRFRRTSSISCSPIHSLLRVGRAIWSAREARAT